MHLDYFKLMIKLKADSYVLCIKKCEFKLNFRYKNFCREIMEVQNESEHFKEDKEND